MSDPISHDDSWDELARELGLDRDPAPPPRSIDETPPAAEIFALEPEPEVDFDLAMNDNELVLDASEEAAGQDEDESDEAGGDDEAGEGQADDGTPGTGRKRRRRRRRRKKTGPGQLETAEGGEAIKPVAEPRAEPVRPRPEPVRPRMEPVRSRPARVQEFASNEDEVEYEMPDDIHSGSAALAAEEDTGGDVLREMILNWNVPSWDEIIGGLHRPER